MSDLVVVTPVDTTQSAGWARARPAVTVVVPTHNRATMLAGLLDALTAQRGVNAEVIIADDGSTDTTWQLLVRHCAHTALPVKALRLPACGGPAVPRNTAVASARAEIVAFTDDDCLPAPDWLAELTAALDASVDIVQGRTLPQPGVWHGPWDRSLAITGPTGLFETANLAVRRESLLAVNGFPHRLVRGSHMGEDVVAGAAIARRGGYRFASAALVHHRVLPGTYRQFVRERLRLGGFPELFAEVPELDRMRYLRIFLGRRRAVVDMGLAGTVAGVVTAAILMNALPLVMTIATLPWISCVWREAATRGRLTRPLRAIQLMVADTVGAAALVAGSIRARRLLL
jgi:glycosyltransferase involved in cell wall biosynthesis